MTPNRFIFPRMVIIGAGFGGLSTAKQLAQAPFDVTIVDRHNYHLFQPLLYQVATAGLSPGDIASPIRGSKRAVAQIGAFKTSGLVAWLLWSLAHIYFLIGFRNRLAVAMNWCWNYVTFQRGTRLITGISGSRIEDVMPVLSSAPALAVSTAVDSGSVEGAQTLRHDDLARQNGPQHA